jgi:uncharacterized protein (TIGR02996 family)
MKVKALPLAETRTFAEALVAVIAAWRRTRHPRLGELAPFLAERAAAEAPRPPLGASKKRADLDAWRAREAAHDPLDFDALMRAARGGAQADVIAHVEALAAWDDPRLVDGLFALLADPPYAGVKSREMLTAIFVALEGARDARAIKMARELAGRYLGIVSSSTGGWIIDQLNKLADRLEELPAPSLTPELDAGCATLEARLGDDVFARRREAARREAAQASLARLFAAVYAAPDDDAPRLVLSDALSELGDARGEFIALQIARARGAHTPEHAKRERALGWRSLAQWAQPLSNVGECTFARGFPDGVRLYGPVKKVLDAPEWATVTRLDAVAKAGVKQAIELLQKPALAGVRELNGLPASSLNALAKVRAWPWIDMAIFDADGLDRDALRAVPGLRALRLDSNGALPEGLCEPLACLERLDLRVRGVLPDGALDGARPRRLVLELGREQERAPRLPPTLEALELEAYRPLPIMLAGLPSLRELDLKIVDEETSGLVGQLAQLPALESLALRLSFRHDEIDAAIFRGLTHLRRLSLFATTLDAGLLRELTGLVELDLRGSLDVPPTLIAGLPRLAKVSGIPACAVSPGLPLVEASVRLARSRPARLDELERLLARYPALPSLTVELHDDEHRDDLAAYVAAVDQRDVRTLRLTSRTGDAIVERDSAGRLTRVRAADEDKRGTEQTLLGALAKPPQA